MLTSSSLFSSCHAVGLESSQAPSADASPECSGEIRLTFKGMPSQETDKEEPSDVEHVVRRSVSIPGGGGGERGTQKFAGEIHGHTCCRCV